MQKFDRAKEFAGEQPSQNQCPLRPDKATNRVTGLDRRLSERSIIALQWPRRMSAQWDKHTDHHKDTHVDHKVVQRQQRDQLG